MCDYKNNDSYEDELDEDENEAGKHLNDDDDDDISDDIIFFFDPEYGYTEDEEDCDEINNLYDENE